MSPVACGLDASRVRLSPAGWITERRLKESFGARGDGGQAGSCQPTLTWSFIASRSSDIPHEAGYLALCTTVIRPREVAGELFMTGGTGM